MVAAGAAQVCIVDMWTDGKATLAWNAGIWTSPLTFILIITTRHHSFREKKPNCQTLAMDQGTGGNTCWHHKHKITIAKPL